MGMTGTGNYIVIRDLRDEGGTDWQIVRAKANAQAATDEAGYSPEPGDVLYVIQFTDMVRFEATTVWEERA